MTWPRSVLPALACATLLSSVVSCGGAAGQLHTEQLQALCEGMARETNVDFACSRAELSGRSGPYQAVVRFRENGSVERFSALRIGDHGIDPYARPPECVDDTIRSLRTEPIAGGVEVPVRIRFDLEAGILSAAAQTDGGCALTLPPRP